MTLSLGLRPRRVDFLPVFLFGRGEGGILIDPSSPLFQNTGGTTPVTAPEQGVVFATDFSGNGLNATQETADERPRNGIVPKGGRRNLLLHSEDYTNAVWVKNGNISVSGNELTYTASTSDWLRQRIAISGATSGRDFTFSVDLRGSSGGEDIDLEIVEFGGASGAAATASSAKTLTDETVRYSVSGTVGANDRTLLELRIRNGNGALAPTITAERPQVDEASAATDYQKVVSQYEVTEEGIPTRRYIQGDGGDSLNSTLPDLGTDATVAYASDQGITIQTGQTIGAGAFDVLRDSQLFGMIVVDRALTAAETAQVTQYLETKGL